MAKRTTRDQFVKIVGLDKALRDIQRLDPESQQSAKDAVVEGAEVVKKAVKAKTPKRTGKLRRSIKRSIRPPFFKGRNEPLRQVVYADAKIAPHQWLVEFGHGGPHPAPPHPYFRPGVIESRGRVKTIITNGLKKAFKL